MFSHGVMGGMSQPEESRKFWYFEHFSSRASVASRTFSGVPIRRMPAGSMLPITSVSAGTFLIISSSISTALPKWYAAAPVERIPLIGMVACGTPKSAQEELQTYIPVDKRLLGNGEFFALKANGESMIEAGISDGDIVFVRYQPTAEDGQVVVAIIDDAEDGGVTATLKRFYKDKHKIRLHPENREMEDIIVDDAKIVGVAVKVLKNIS